MKLGKTKDWVKDKLKDVKHKVKESVSFPHRPVIQPSICEPQHEADRSLPEPKAASTHYASTDGDAAASTFLTLPKSTITQGSNQSIPTIAFDESPKSSERLSSPPKSTFIKTANPQHDIAVLHVAFVLKDSPDLQELVLAVQKLNGYPPKMVELCAQFTAQLINAFDAKVDGVDRAVVMFLWTVKNTISQGSSETRVSQDMISASIKEIKDTYPDISTIEEKKHSSRLSTIASEVLGVTLPIFDIIQKGSSMIPVPMVQPLIGVVAGFLQAADQASNNFEWMRWLATTAAEYVVRIVVLCPQEAEEHWTQAINTLQEKLFTIVRAADEFSRRSVFSRFVQQARDKGDIARMKDDLKSAIAIFNAELNLNIKLDLDTISRKIDNIMLAKLERLPAHSDSNDRYFGDSRKREIQDTLHWIEEPDSKHFLWIHGGAGVGKSTLARELLEHFKREGVLATFASFAIGIDSKPKVLVRMMARELCSLHPGCQSFVARAMTDCFGEHEHLKKYITHFLVQPITSLAYAGPLVIILDALDEWADQQDFLRSLFKVGLPPNLKIVMTSRYLKDVASVVGDAAQLYELKPVSNTVCRAYFENRFQQIDWEQHEPEPFKIDKLVELSDGLLIWAATVYTLVSTPSPDKRPIEMLDEIIASSAFLAREERMGTLYRMALDRLFPDQTSKKWRFKIILSMVALREALPLKEFARLVDVRAKFVTETYSRLRALQTRGTFDDNMVPPAIKMFHASFIDYFGHDQARNVMADNCICFFKTVSNPDVDEPESQPFPFWKAQLYVYMSKHWAGHLEEGQSEQCSETFLDVTSDQLRLWVAWLLSRLLFLEDKHDYQLQPSSLMLQTLSAALCSAEGMSYSPEMWLRDLSTTQAVVADFRHTLDYGKIDYHNRDFYIQKQDYARRWALVINGLAIGLQQIQRLTLDSTGLDTVIDILDNLITVDPPDLPEHPAFCNNLGFALYSRFELKRSRNDLERAILLHMKALGTHVQDSRNYAISLGNLGRALESRVQHFGSNPKDLEEAVAYHRQALPLFQRPDDPLRPSSLYSLGNSLIQTYSTASESSHYLEEAVSLFCAVTQSRPPSYVLRLHAARKDGLIKAIRTVAQHMQYPGSDFRGVQLVGLDQGPHIQIDLEKGAIVFKILDPLLNTHGTQSLSTNSEVDVQASCAGFLRFLDIIHIDPDPSSIPKPPLFALVIGINIYKSNTLQDLRGAQSDAIEFVAYLKNDLLVPSNQIILLLNENATRSNIIEGFNALATDSRIEKGDPIIIYYSGHGMACRNWESGGRNSDLILPHDYSTEPKQGGLSARFIGILIESIADGKGDNITAIFDCSNFGSITRTFNGNDSATFRRSRVLEPGSYDSKPHRHLWNTGTRGNWRSLIPSSTCRTLEYAKYARESEGHGAVSAVFLELLHAHFPNNLRYCDIPTPMDPIPSGNPQCKAINQHRILISRKVLPPAPVRGSSCYPIAFEDIGKPPSPQLILEAGSAQGITDGAEFTVYLASNTKLKFAIGSVTVSTAAAFTSTAFTSTAFISTMIFTSNRLLSRPVFAVQTKAGKKKGLRLFVPPGDPFHDIYKAIHEDKTIAKYNLHNITLVDEYWRDTAHLQASVKNGRMVLKMMDERVTQYGFERQFNVDASDLDALALVLERTTHFYEELCWANSNRSISGRIGIEFYQLGDEDEFADEEEFHELADEEEFHELADEEEFVEYSPGPNLCIDNIVDFVVKENFPYGLKLINKTRYDLYPYLFYFDNNDLSISSYYEPPAPGPNSDVPLKSMGEVTLGYGLGAMRPFSYTLGDDQNINVGFLKLFVSTEYVGLAHIPQVSPFESAYRKSPSTDFPVLSPIIRTSKPVDLPDIRVSRPPDIRVSGLVKYTPPIVKARRKWETLLVPIVRRRYPARETATTTSATKQ